MDGAQWATRKRSSATTTITQPCISAVAGAVDPTDRVVAVAAGVTMSTIRGVRIATERAGASIAKTAAFRFARAAQPLVASVAGASNATLAVAAESTARSATHQRTRRRWRRTSGEVVVLEPSQRVSLRLLSPYMALMVSRRKAVRTPSTDGVSRKLVPKVGAEGIRQQTLLATKVHANVNLGKSSL